MPLLRHSLYSQNVNLYLAPTADARDTWLPLMRTIASEGRVVLLSANQCLKRKDLPSWIRGESPSQVEHGQRDVKGGRGMSARRRSTVTKTEDNHEITWPPIDVKFSKPGVVRETKTDGSSPLRDSAVIEGDDEDDEDPHVNGYQKTTMGKAEDDHEPNPSAGGHISKQSQASTKGAASSSADDEEFVSRGGSCIISPLGEVLSGPLWDVDDGRLLVVEVDFEDCERGRLDLDVAGSYSRNDAFKLTVEGLDLSPPP